MKISVCWIAKNEETHIARAINSMKGFVDEMIVVDTGSSDGTVEVARALGAKIGYFEWDNDFAAARNYAMSLATGDVLMCPDADMWYDPPFGQAHRDAIEKALSQPKAEAVIAKLIDIEGSTGVVINEAHITVAYRRSPNMKYFGAIHEQMLHLDGSFLRMVNTKAFAIHHSGYSAASIKEKTSRNVSMLLEAAKKEEAEMGGAHRPLTDFYLMRENVFHGSRDEAVRAFLALHKSRSALEDVLAYEVIATSYYYLAMQAAAAGRRKVSRLDIHKNLVEDMKRRFPRYAGAKTFDLVYQVNFDLKSDVFIRGFDEALAGFDRSSPVNDSDSLRSFSALCVKAASICWNKGLLEKAFEYCVARFKCSDAFSAEAFAILLSCIKGQPESEIIVFLNSIFDQNNPVHAHTLTEGLQHEGFQTVFSYYVMKQLERGVAATKHLLQLLILNGSYEDAIGRVAAMDRNDEPGMAADIVFFAIFCSGDRGLMERHGDLLSEGGRELLECHFDGGPAPDGQRYGLDAVSDMFGAVAFMAGLDRANELLRLFSASPRLCFAVESKYLIENALYPDVIHSLYRVGLDDDPDALDTLLTALVRSGSYDSALAKIKGRLSSCQLDHGLLNHLLDLAECGDARVAGEARPLYDRYMYLYDEYIDMNDVLMTGLVFDRYRKRDRRMFAEMGMDGLASAINADGMLTDHMLYLMTIEQAARIYEKERMEMMALHCHMRLCACGYKPKDTIGHMSRLAKKLDNRELSRQLAEKAEGMKDGPVDRPIGRPPFLP
ncbi:MAG: glycosyltransferase family 2 protein [Clostridiales Family XIII bacterium]|jgi:glycosyltransferase involved in cell wall biosynthesis|nr:glycosyltransferase family 2 protein [Clostridiales Family XIII bacterium]